MSTRATTHSLPHLGRAPSNPSTHTRVRWQPYYASLPSITTRSPSNNAYLPTPASSIYSSTPSPVSLRAPERPRAQVSRECQVRDLHKSRYASSLVDQAVKSICDIWNPQDIPPVFLTSPPRPAHAHEAVGGSASLPAHAFINSQLPSPISPTTSYSPVTSSNVPPFALPRRSHLQCMPSSQANTGNLTPMKTFVHEVLRRSRTSGTVLQTALCYIEAIRSKVPELVRQEQSGQGVRGEPELASRIIQGEVDVASDVSPVGCNSTDPLDSLVETVRVDALELDGNGSQVEMDMGLSVPTPKVSNAAPPPPLPPLPSPLLCPRRAFLAALILASKFMQDRCFSNRAWAKLSGLPPREIGRCERALGEALDWRLWVGKLPAAQTTSENRQLTKCKSENDIGAFDTHTPSRGLLSRHATFPAGLISQEISTGAAPIDMTWTSGIASSSVGSSYVPWSPATPGLSYSPTSTESSCGDRTVQMTFMDDSTPPPAQPSAFGLASHESKAIDCKQAPADVFYAQSTQPFASYGIMVPHQLGDESDVNGLSISALRDSFYAPPWSTDFVRVS
ncbi:hypothetical protein CONPUDRAFT_143136 [Coniophora puteana RWD-64-598 SS2]|uniref:Cyclin N-terminal domain-containing protein n=1 Tax=Coniophora puteana (strain RWD-64-598) TaxID=741705 RepID=A0A5M3MWZ7_CONPW|nr:uncharacterized protein CONPUDRAFT_143136 [Coniophora puteana RWD-64-598 SS2]EIW83131.1 hypothetical protein CONPUDRAFT_143136 [Coniophora puteana RWD-64-598 SS2]